MADNPENHCRPRYRLLTQPQIQRLHQATLELLDTVGVRVFHDESCRMLADSGCRLDSDQRVRIPASLVETAIRSAPSSVTIYDREGRQAMRLEGRRVHYGLGTDLLHTYDLKTGRMRPSCRQDVINAAVVADALDEIDFIASNAFPQDVPGNLAFIAEFQAQISHSSKPVYFTAAARQDLEYIIDIATVAAGGQDRLREKPFLIHYAEPLSPLVHSTGAVDKLLCCADKGIPLNYVPALMSGATGPVTLAGAIVTANAEALSGLVIHQLRRKGAPMISGFSATPMDMHKGTTVYGSPDERLTHSACCDLYHFYELPVWGEAGCSDAKSLDAQAGYEAAFSLLLATLDGCNLIHDVGYLGQGLIGSPAAIVMGAELISWVKRMVRGFEIGPQQIGLNVISRVGPGGHFLAQKETVRHLRQEHWLPQLSDRNHPDAWIESGAPDLNRQAVEKAQDLLRTHPGRQLQDEKQQRIDALYARAEKDLEGVRFGN
jgi:trimethylamine--corrinoid protein Co-methyltransferase